MTDLADIVDSVILVVISAEACKDEVKGERNLRGGSGNRLLLVDDDGLDIG
jgi:hypothetical protein